MRMAIAADFRLAGRVFARNKAFAAIAVISLALGMGGAASVFSVVDRILFRSLPFGQSEQLVSVGLHAPVLPYDFLLGAGYLQLRRNLPEGLAAVTSWTGVNDCDLTGGAPLRVSCAAVESTFLSTLGIVPVLGRSFTAAEDAPQAPPVVLISYGLWQSRFAGRPDALDRLIALDGRPARIVGVLPRDFETPTLARADLLVPQRLDDATLARAVTGRPLRIIGRLKEGANAARLESQGGAVLQAELASARAHLPQAKEIRLRVRSLRDLQVGDARTASWVLLGTVLAVLLLACANVTNLLLARSFARRKEMAIRAALGANRWQLVRPALAESILLTLAGGLAGAALAWALLRLFIRLAPQGIPRLGEATIDGRVLAFTAGCALAAGVVMGLVAGWRGETRVESTRRGRLRFVLVAAQCALSLALLTGASLLGRALWHFQSQSLGMETQHILTASLSLPVERYPQAAQQLAFSEQLESLLVAAPGMSVAAIGDSYPPNVPLRSRPATVLSVDGHDPDGVMQGSVVWRAVSPEYFRALGIRIVRGRPFQEQDRNPGAGAVILSEALARRMFGSKDPLGHVLGTKGMSGGERIVGVAENVKNSGGTGADDPEYYEARPHDSRAGIYGAPNELRHIAAIVRTPLEHGAAARALRQAVAAIDGSIPLEIATMGESTARLSERPRFQATLLGLFAGIGLALAAVGLYGVLGFLVAQRTREIGVRMALGATPGGIGRMMMGEAGRWVAAGLACGFALSAAIARALGPLLLGVRASDPAAWLSAAGLLLLAAVAAAWVPARRAARVDPMQALKEGL